MAEHPNALLLKKVYEAYTSGDVETLGQLFAPDAVIHLPGRGRFAGSYRGLQSYMEMVGKLMEISGGTLRLERHDTTASDEHAINLERLTASRGDKRLDVQLAFVCHVRGGKVVEAWDMFSDTQAVDDFWS
jgi:ketosteroid isomerase-like protein